MLKTKQKALNWELKLKAPFSDILKQLFYVSWIIKME